MDNETGVNPIILVVEDVHETRDGTTALKTAESRWISRGVSFEMN